jgi:beta-mannosidase
LTAPGDTSLERRQLLDEWSLAEVAPGRVDDPGRLAGQVAWRSVRVPTTVAALLRDGGVDPLTLTDLDSREFWFRCDFRCEELAPGEICALDLEGLATFADVWLGGQPLLSSSNMFLPRSVRIEHLLEPANSLVVRFRPLAAEPVPTRPRARWRTQLVADQGLRHHRTTLLGRIPGWSAFAPAIGPWRAVSLRFGAGLLVEESSVLATVGAGGAVPKRAA